MSEPTTGRYQKKILTVPNLLSLFRLLLVPVFCWTYLGLHNMWWTVGLLALSGLTDMADGWIARRFDMISDVGKVLDPVADKVTQGAMLLCLLISFPVMLPAFLMLAVKELADLFTGWLVVKKTGKVLQAEWHGKLATAVLYGTMILHVLWQAFAQIPSWLTLALVILCTLLQLLSLILYTVRNIRAMRQGSSEALPGEAASAE